MKVVRIFSLLLLVLLHGCDTGKEYIDYDNQEEVTGFRKTHNDKVLDELQTKKEELSKQIADQPEKEEDQAKLKEELANTNRRLGYPEFFKVATMNDLPNDLAWEDGMDQPELG